MNYTDEQVERVAEAIAEAEGRWVYAELKDAGEEPPAWDWEQGYTPGKDDYRKQARAALEAMTPEPPLDANTDYITAAANEVEAYLFTAAEDDEPLWQVMGRERFSIGSAALRGVDKLRAAANAKDAS